MPYKMRRFAKRSSSYIRFALYNIGMHKKVYPILICENLSFESIEVWPKLMVCLVGLKIIFLENNFSCKIIFSSYLPLFGKKKNELYE